MPRWCPGFIPLILSLVIAGTTSNCGRSPSALMPSFSAKDGSHPVGVVQAEQVHLSPPIVPSYGADIRIDLALTPGSADLPTSLTIAGIRFVPISQTLVPGWRSYGVTLDAALQRLPEVERLDVLTADGVPVQIVYLDQDRAQAEAHLSMIYESNPMTVSTRDIALALATLQVEYPIAANIIAQANALLGSPGAITTVDPLPNRENTNYVNKGSGTLNTIDVAAILAAIQLQPGPITRASLASQINVLLEISDWVQPEEIIRIPGAGFPGVLTLSPPLPDPTFAGDTAISVENNSIPVGLILPTTLTIMGTNGAATYVQTLSPPFNGFTTYLPDLSSAIVNLTGSGTLSANSLSCAVLLTVHSPQLDPSVAVNQISQTILCP